MSNVVLANFLDSLSLRRLGDDQAGGLCISSVPLPRQAPATLALGGRSTYAKPLGQWWGSTQPAPRRMLLIADGGSTPAQLSLSRSGAAPQGPPVVASDPVFAASEDADVYWERRLLRLAWGGKSISLALGLRVHGFLRWWEFSRLIQVSRTPQCLEVQMAGSIPTELFSGNDLRKYPGYTLPQLHRHTWLSGQIYARLHNNGVCEIYARHINSRFFDDGLPLECVVPVVGFRVDDQEVKAGVTEGSWDGSVSELDFDGVRLDVSEAARLATPKQPGNWSRGDGFAVWQPYLGCELYGGLCPNQLTGDPFIFHAERPVFPRGMSRTLRFSVSLNPQRSPRVVRYLAPSWWYGLCEELTPHARLPVTDHCEPALQACQKFLRQYIVRNGFEDGSIPRHLGKTLAPGRYEPGWEGEAAGAALLLAYRTGEATDFYDGLRASYTFTDVYIDHAANSVRMHGYAPNAFALPMNRVQACLYAYLETGDEFCLDTAKKVIENSYWTHKNSWPRTAMGRDACFIRGAVLLYRYLNDNHFLEIARKSIPDVCAVQNPEGWFGDQGGGSGVHGWAAYIAKPWMGLMALGGVLDYLDLFPDGDQAALDCVFRFADWLMKERFDHKGVMGWSYQHLFAGKRTMRFLQTGEAVKLPTEGLWHLDYLARLLTFCSVRKGDPSYYAAFVESYDGDDKERNGDHSFAQSVQYLPWMQGLVWNAQLDAAGQVVSAPAALGERAPSEGIAHGPSGPVTIRRTAAGKA